jgi:4-amino-4-deoxychorismate lyase
MTERSWVDGVEGAEVPIDDRGFNLADGAFETMRVKAGLPACFSLHRARLAAGLSCLGFDSPAKTAEKALLDALEWLRAIDREASGVLRLTLTRGSGPRGYRALSGLPTRLVSRFLPGEIEPPLAPARMGIAPICYASQPFFHGAKLLARAEQVVATSWAHQQGYDDALMSSAEGRWVSAGSGNLFLRLGTRLMTPPVDDMGIAGTRRELILSTLATSAGYEVAVEPCTEEIARGADEAFLCNAVVGIRSIQSVADIGFASTAAAERLRPLIHDWNDCGATLR